MLLGASWLCASKAAAAAAQSEGDDERPGERRRRRAAAAAAAAGEEMDESSLLDLLECSVCLERLDTTAKVLPCQHTFCRRCLESIVCSRHELRCPECRILVGCGVDELPANILLVRLLDGIRQRPRAGGSGSGSSSNGGSPTARPYPGAAAPALGGGGGAAGSAPGSPVFLPAAAAAAAAAGTGAVAGSATSSLRELAAASRSAPLAKNISQLPYGKALYNYEGKEPGDLKFNKGDIIMLRRKVDENWYHGELNGNHGFLPASYIQCLRPLPQAPPQGKALYDFEIKDKDQDKDCLTFTKDPSSTAGSATLAVARAGAASGEQTTSPKVQLPLNVYLALYAYKPQKNDELELRKGEMYRVIEKCQDGWFKGTSLRTGVSGVFPGNYVTPVSRVPVGGAGPPRNNVLGGSPLAKGMTTTIHPGGGSLSSPATATRPALPLTTPQAHAQHQAASPPMGSCLRHSAQPVASQARSTIPTAAHSSAQAQDRPTATVSPLRTQNSPSRLPAASLRPHSVVSPQHVHQSPIQMVVGAQCPRPIIPLTSAASAITPPNVSAANLNGEVGGGHIGGLLTSSPTNTGCKAEEKKNEKKEKKSGLLKLLAGASTKKKSRSPPSISPTHDPQVDASLQGAVGPEVSSLSSHGRAGSCPIESEMQGAMGMEPLHRKTGSLDLNFSLSPSRQVPLSMAAIHPEPKPLSRERYRVVVSYPPQSEAEIELKEGDIVFVHKKREDGWYKGTLQRNGRTGLFPGSFVESF
ncbi:E3 ubiquitin-protein ligase SH3RF3 isoform X5 [Tenrec ecaudatus]|uniref:E3 ubiquitin-protein ligase SH3RF3 isoform X5 n=1 Tax=Tenrec ecaudatus TaxID=94439 RepID=UPI003F5A51E0